MGETNASRERFEKAFAAKYYTVDQLAKQTMADLWEQAERDTRERCAQIAEKFWLRPHNKFGEDIATAIRGKE